MGLLDGLTGLMGDVASLVRRRSPSGTRPDPDRSDLSPDWWPDDDLSSGWVALGSGEAALLVDEIEHLRLRTERLRSALICIAHTLSEDSRGGARTLPAGEYQEMARRALALDAELSSGDPGAPSSGVWRAGGPRR